MPAFEGGAAQPVTVDTTGGKRQAGAAIPVYVASGGPQIAGPARRVVVVTDGPVEERTAVPIYDAGIGAVAIDGPALPVFFVGSDLPLLLVRSGLVVEYRFDDGQGTILTDYAGGYHGTLGTGAADRPDWAPAGLDFVPGNADVVTNATMPDSVFLGANGFTVCVVARFDTGSAIRHFLGKHATSGATQNPIDFRTDSSATPIVRLARANTATRSWAMNVSSTLGAYRMYSVVTAQTIDSTPAFYIGATPVGATSIGSGTGVPTGSSANLRIGRRADGAAQMDGVISYILIYNRQLSAAEIARNYAVLQVLLAPRGVNLP